MNAIAIPEKGRHRAVIEGVTPQVDTGRHPIKRIVGESVVVEADIFADGHDLLSAVVKYRPQKTAEWSETLMESLLNDRWRGRFVVTEPGRYCYTIEAWVDHFKSWRQDLQKKLEVQKDVSLEIVTGAKFIEAAAGRATALDAERLLDWAVELRTGNCATGGSMVERALDETMAGLMERYSDRRFATTWENELSVMVEPEWAQFSAWYEMFPRSFATEPGKHGTLKDCEAQLPRIAGMGFDVLYLPPIHPIGKSFRKGKNNNPVCEPDGPGSPWGIGAAEGGHKSIHPELGTLEDFRRFVQRVGDHGLKLALDIAFQCSPDHPYVKEHSEWFLHRPDGSIQYAENPPKKYQDIFPFDFECEDWRSLWQELKSIFEFWMAQGVKIFRVDNPHTKTFAFWEWCVADLKRRDPGVIFLSEAFTRPKVMYRLAKTGFTQSYNYFPWRNGKEELTGYFTELTGGPLAEFFYPNLWPNTPDVLPQYLQTGGRAAFIVRLVLAATLGANYGIYGPAFELCENMPRDPEGEEYLNSEKYEIKRWDLQSPQRLEPLIGRVNRIRRENPALQHNRGLKFHPVDNEQLLAYTKSTEDGTDTILTVVNLDPHHRHYGWLELPLEEFHLDPRRTYQMHDLLADARYLWQGPRNYVELDPAKMPAHIFRLRRHVRTERDFDYFL